MLASVSVASAATDTVIYRVGSQSTRSSFSVNLTNRSANTVKVRVALCAVAATSAAQDGSNWIEYDTILQPNDTLERTGLVLLPNQPLIVQVSAANAVNVVVYGIEE